jgi:DNA gyrase subunit A
MGVREILSEWCTWRVECIKRRYFYDVSHLKERLHLLKGLQKILLDIDKAIKIIRETEEESEVIPNLIIGFHIDEVQAEYVADIRLRNINRQYLLKRTEEIEQLETQIQAMELILADRKKQEKVIIDELNEIIKKYAIPRHTLLVFDHVEYQAQDDVENYPVHIFLSQEGYFKKITPNSLRMNSEQKYKEGDGASQSFSAENNDEILFLTSNQQCYKAKLSEFEDTKSSVLGEYVANKLGFDENETVVYSVLPGDYTGSLLFIFENGKVGRVDLSQYQSNRRKLQNAYSGTSPLVQIFHLSQEEEILMMATDRRALVFHTSKIPLKTTRSTQGIFVMTLKGKQKVKSACLFADSKISNTVRFRVRNIPSSGLMATMEETGEQLTLD